jgi:hypothetical protein
MRNGTGNTRRYCRPTAAMAAVLRSIRALDDSDSPRLAGPGRLSWFSLQLLYENHIDMALVEGRDDG